MLFNCLKSCLNTKDSTREIWLTPIEKKKCCRKKWPDLATTLRPNTEEDNSTIKTLNMKNLRHEWLRLLILIILYRWIIFFLFGGRVVAVAVISMLQSSNKESISQLYFSAFHCEFWFFYYLLNFAVTFWFLQAIAINIFSIVYWTRESFTRKNENFRIIV